MLTWMYITNDPKLASIAYAAGVQRLFVDWEIHGKQQRQGHLDTVISKHSYDDAVKIRAAVPDAELLIRLNPCHDGTADEVEKALDAGANLIMLPMFNTFEEVEGLCQIVRGRAGVVPLLETPESIEIAEQLAHLDGIYELYVGLNDLHLGLKMNFMFEPLAKGMLDKVAAFAKSANVRFGFGGVARVGEGEVPGEMVLSEHMRLGSSAVILSRTFFRSDEVKNEDSVQEFSRELQRLISAEQLLLERSETQILSDQKLFQAAVDRVVGLIRERKS